MYSALKVSLKKFLPEKFLFENEVFLRKFLLPIYRGNACECNVCGAKLKKFILLGTGDLLCPACGSLPRTRRLWKILNENFLKTDEFILDFSPSRAIYRKLKKNKGIHYFPTDFENEFLADYHFDITDIATDSEKFNLIICYHILEHIEDDGKAISELCRVLKSGGTLLVQTPFKEGEIFEDHYMKTPEERKKAFGQEDHVRIYSVEGLKQRLENNGFSVEVIKFSGHKNIGLADNETVLFAKK